MNVVPVSGSNTLPVIYDRGLIGVMHDWYFIKIISHFVKRILLGIKLNRNKKQCY